MVKEERGGVSEVSEGVSSAASAAAAWAESSCCEASLRLAFDKTTFFAVLDSGAMSTMVA